MRGSFVVGRMQYSGGPRVRELGQTRMKSKKASEASAGVS